MAADARRTGDSRARTGIAAGLGQELAAAGVLLLLVAAFNPGLALLGRVLGGYDTFVYFYPLRSYIAETLGQGRLPLWNPYLFGGAPYLANTQTAVFYPGTWIFALVDVPRAYALNFLGHLWIAGLALYAFARVSLGLGRVASVVGGAAFAFSGFMNGQAGHINQFSVAAWLPAVALALDLAMRSRRLVPVLPLAALVAGLTLQILAGHPQQVYMTVVALGVLVLWRGLLGARPSWPHPERAGSPRSQVAALLRGGVALGMAAALAAGISAVQLLPTLELSQLSIRGGGLSYELAAFDALPWPLLLPALFPGYWMHLPTTEFFGHTGTVLFALAWLGLLGGAGRPALLGAAYVTLGLLLAVGDATPLYRLLFDWAPGFASFRVPARWLLVSTFGLAILAAVGTDWLTRLLLNLESGGPAALQAILGRIGPVRGVLAGLLVPLGLASLVAWGQPQSKWLLLVWGLLTIAALSQVLLGVLSPRARHAALAVLLVGALADLWVAGMSLEHRHPMPNIAYGQPREATVELQARAQAASGFRSFSVATPEYVVKETAEYEEQYAHLPPQSLENLLVAVKWNETLWPNVPLVHRIRSIDGYDGGVLPLRSYYDLAQALLGPERARPDGVLASRLDAAPEARWLDLMGVRWVLAGRAKDETRGAVYYDRGLTRTLYPGESVTLSSLPLGEFTTLGMISSTSEARHDDPPSFRSRQSPTVGPSAAGERAGTLRLIAADGAATEVPLLVGSATAPETWSADQAPALERVEPWSSRGPEAPSDWIAEIEFNRQEVVNLEIVNDSANRALQIRALNLIDNGRQMAFPISTDSRVERLDFFDVKLYDRHDALPRAYLVSRTSVMDDAAAAARLADPSFDPRREAILAPGPTASALEGATPAGQFTPGPSAGAGRAAVLSGSAGIELERPDFAQVAVRAEAESVLVLSDSWYPGWVATLDGEPVPIERANLLFRAVRVPAGEHVVEFRYEPQSVSTGALVSAGSLVLTVGLTVGGLWWRRRQGGGMA